MQTKQILYVLWTSTVWALQYLQHPLEVLEVAWVNCLNIMVCHFHTQYMFVERASEIHIQQLPIKQCLGHLKELHIKSTLVQLILDFGWYKSEIQTKEIHYNW